MARREDRLSAIAGEIRADYGVDYQLIVADLSESDAGAQISSTCLSASWQFSWLINNAGVAGPDLLKDRDWATQQTFFQLMILSVGDLCHRMIPGVAERGYGHVINVECVAARAPRSGGCNYGPAKT